ncbi:hypothetical protein HYX16_02415 [Candidatus Woesearchaeota archaeon]|nr:hypothetical protein [Candidatus Woesearchaeota archaeon]
MIRGVKLALEEYIVNLLKIVFVVLAGHISLTKVIPLLDGLLSELIKEKKAVDNFTSLLGILVFVLVGMKIVEFALATQNKIISYLSVVKPGLDLLMSLSSYFGWILAGAVVVLGLRSFRK